VTPEFKMSLERQEKPRGAKMGPKELKGLQYLEDPLCGDVGSFPLRFKGHPSRVAKAFVKRLHNAGHDLAALSPAPFKETYARRTGRTRR
jgi:hypothetical protein